ARVDANAVTLAALRPRARASARTCRILWDRRTRPGVSHRICETFALPQRPWRGYPPVHREKANSYCCAERAGPILCAIALIVALLVAAVVVLAAALIGGNVGRAITGSSDPTGTIGSGKLEVIGLGDYVTVQGNLVAFGEDNNAIVSWWVESTYIYGRSVHGEGTGGGAPFNY